MISIAITRTPVPQFRNGSKRADPEKMAPSGTRIWQTLSSSQNRHRAYEKRRYEVISYSSLGQARHDWPDAPDGTTSPTEHFNSSSIKDN